MALPDSYTLKPGSIPAYFEAMLGAEAPDRFSTRFLENLEFKTTTDRLFIGVLKELGFINADGVPTDRYYEFLDRTQSARVVADGVREAYSGLFAVQTEAHTLNQTEVRNKLRTLYKGTKKTNVITRIAATFAALCDFADFSTVKATEKTPDVTKETKETKDSGKADRPTPPRVVELDSLQYHINIVLPESKDQAVYDAIFKSLRDHLGVRRE